MRELGFSFLFFFLFSKSARGVSEKTPHLIFLFLFFFLPNSGRREEGFAADFCRVASGQRSTAGLQLRDGDKTKQKTGLKEMRKGRRMWRRAKKGSNRGAPLKQRTSKEELPCPALAVSTP